MRFPFLDREREAARLRRALDSGGSSLVCLYGRRRLGKSRLLQELLEGRRAAYYVGDDRDAALQRAAVAREVARLLPGFDQVAYPSWDALLERWWREAPPGAVLALDEFPALVSSAPSLPSELQRHVDATGSARHTILCGSSQRMMLGLLLDASAPLYGRARELLRVEPLPLWWLGRALRLERPEDVVSHHAVFGGVPRYWELAADHADLWGAVEDLLLDPMGPLHREPRRLLLDDMREVARAASILALVGQGCHRISEIGGRLGVPATSLSRPVDRLLELGLLHRDLPFGSPERGGKRSLYAIADPLLRFWYRFVDPNRSRLEAGQADAVRREIERAWPQFLGGAWEVLARQSVAHLELEGGTFLPARRWWDKREELDIVAASADDPDHVLVGEAKLTCAAHEVAPLLEGLERRARSCPALRGKRLSFALWILGRRGPSRDPRVLTAADVVEALR